MPEHNPKSETSLFLDAAKKAALEAGRIQMEHFGSETRIMKKSSDIDLVTQTDIDADKAIREIIQKEFPSHTIISEELETIDKGKEYVWYIDPVDGTNNFAHGYPQFCVSISLVHNSTRIVGVVYNAAADELFHAVRGDGAYLNDRRIRVSDIDSVKQSLVSSGFPYSRARFREPVLTRIAKIYDNAMGFRRSGSAAIDLCNVACGRADAYYELSIKPWDIQAGILIVEEAGGRSSTLEGRKIPFKECSILAANPLVFDRFLNLLKEK